MRTSLMFAANLAAIATAVHGDGDLRPAWADVVGLARGESLVVRDRPCPAARQIGAIPAGTEGVDVVSGETAAMRSGGPGWCFVVHRGTRGWVDARFLDVYGDA